MDTTDIDADTPTDTDTETCIRRYTDKVASDISQLASRNLQLAIPQLAVGWHLASSTSHLDQ